jgi:DNA-directed RNA polymerase subunit N (RpoN/RPB10)
MYRKRKRTKTDTSVDMEKIKEQIKQELIAEMQMQNMHMQRWCCHQMVLSPVSNRASPSLATLKSSCASADNVGLIEGTAELATKVCCDDRTHEDLIGMLTEPTHCGLWITWRGLQCEAAIGLVHPEQAMLQTVPIHEDCVVVEVLTIYTIFADELVEYPPNNKVMKLGQAEGQRLQWRMCRIDIKGAPTCKSRSQATVQIPCSSQSTVQVLTHMVPHILLLLLLNPHIRKMFHSDLLLVLKKLASPPPRHPGNTEKLASPHPQDTLNIPSPPTTSPEKIEELASPHY